MFNKEESGIHTLCMFHKTLQYSKSISKNNFVVSVCDIHHLETLDSVEDLLKKSQL